jgi:hypothetical protein
MKKSVNFLATMALAMVVLLSACKKENTNTRQDDATEFQIQTDDQARFSNETDAAANDAQAALESVGGSYMFGRPQTPPIASPCDATITVDTTSNPRKITVTYTGAGCLGNRTRSGSIIVSFAPAFRWAAPGATYTVTYQNLKITRNTDNKSITFNGTKTVKNVSGGLLKNLATATQPMIHEVTSNNMSVTFDNGAQRTWQLAKRRTFTYDNGIVIAVSGIAPQGGGVAEWGTNRASREFTAAILQPITIKQSCNFRLVSGQVKYNIPIITTTTTFGLNAEGNPISNCPTGPFYYKVVWTLPNGVSQTYIGPY